MIFTPSKHSPTQSVFSRNLIAILTGNKIFISLISDISPRKASKYYTIQNCRTKSRVYTAEDRLSSAHYYFRRKNPEISGETLMVLTFEH